MVTIVIPTYNRADIVERTLISVERQTHRPLKVVLVDNNSTDNTRKVLEQWQQRVQAPDFDVTIIDEKKPGATAARNAGLALVDTPWTMFFDSDDTMQPEHVARAVKAAQDNPQAAIIGWDVRMHMLDGSTPIKPFKVKDAEYFAVHQGIMATQRYMALTDIMRRAGGWNEDMKVWNDIEFGVRILRSMYAGLSIIKLGGEPTVDVYSQVKSITGTDYSHHVDDLKRTLDTIQQNLPIRRRYIVDLRRCTLAANVAREGSNDQAKILLKSVLGTNLPAWRKLLYRLAYIYTRMGGRGAAVLLHPLL